MYQGQCESQSNEGQSIRKDLRDSIKMFAVEPYLLTEALDNLR